MKRMSKIVLGAALFLISACTGYQSASISTCNPEVVADFYNQFGRVWIAWGGAVDYADSLAEHSVSGNTFDEAIEVLVMTQRRMEGEPYPDCLSEEVTSLLQGVEDTIAAFHEFRMNGEWTEPALRLRRSGQEKEEGFLQVIAGILAQGEP